MIMYSFIYILSQCIIVVYKYLSMYEYMRYIQNVNVTYVHGDYS